VKEFERLVSNDPGKLKVFNPVGLCAAHNAAARNRTTILALIVQYNGGAATDIIAFLLLSPIDCF
jgi:hypothetical protein